MDDIVFLFDVDNTLLDNDRVQQDLDAHLSAAYGEARRSRYWAIYDELFATLGYADYFGALQRLRLEALYEPRLLALAAWLIDYPFAERLFPGALDAVDHVRQWGRVVLLSDGDAVYQPRKAERSGLSGAFGGEVLIFVHKEKELDFIERLYPARRYALIDDKLRVLSAVKAVWGDRVATVFPRQGRYARDAETLASHPKADVTIETIRDIVALDRGAFAP
ncbi:haloacid dehalogenase-like hydrolase [Roseiarcus fermentans]|uniref:Haloacid dehalogenase-like hydrolase n=1 Tax=Roseiarcus fermentans TaxID=1473586 RepID=A0A366F977_9HYPH|nr:HAD family hydrolase [Roseiarcus fermentans]RBP11212.1 haloacid dehalogenase-like hydrolase [Roseiarcus fermentans]